MFTKLYLPTIEKIKFFDAILKHLADNYSLKVTIKDLQSKINYSDERIRNLSHFDSFFEEGKIEETYQKSLNLLIASGYIIQDPEQYSLTVPGLTIVTSGGLLGKERRDIKKYNFQNLVWFFVVLTFATNLFFQILSFSKSAVPFQTCGCKSKIGIQCK